MQNLIVSFENFKIQKDFYFLSHFHKDHLKGLQKKHHQGKILCSLLTARYLRYFYQIEETFIIALDYFTPFDLGQGWQATLYPANHSLDASMMVLSHFDKNLHFLYTGDFRYDEEIFKDFPFHLTFQKAFIDTTYLDFNYDFPTKQEAILQIQNKITSQAWQEVFIGTYYTGKEAIFTTLSKNLSVLFCTSKKKLTYYQLAQIDSFFTFQKTGYFCYNMHDLFLISPQKTQNSLVVFPTGWVASSFKNSKHANTFNIPYSEHCSKKELLIFLNQLSCQEFYTLPGKPLNF